MDVHKVRRNDFKSFYKSALNNYFCVEPNQGK
jgi:hypothetical protein